MILATVELQGYRNFKKAKINLQSKSLIIGANDVGKTNFLWAIRLLLDRNLSDYDMEPNDSDFYAYESTNAFHILLSFTDVVEDCVVSKMKGKISNDNKLFIKYEAYRDKETKAKSYKLFAGPSVAELEEIEDRYYRKVLNVKYISSRRDLHNYVNREKGYLFQASKENRSDSEKDSDNKLYNKIQEDLKKVDEMIPKLNFISSATNLINNELSHLSIHHTKQTVVFDSSTSNVDSFINNVSIASKSSNGQSVQIGGDGRLNQIYIALWASRNGLTEESINEVTIFCIEEPEAHLHPHQQRKLADYLNKSLKGQVLITTHSPQIASEFSPNSIVRLLNQKNNSIAASGGCSPIIGGAFKDFGYRLSIIPAEAFFSDVVFLVEGISEEMFYKTLSKELNMDIDRLNISILMVDGIGFETYINILNSLGIAWVIRTDNDIFKIPYKNEFSLAGVKRCISYYRKFIASDTELDKILLEHESNLTWPENYSPPQSSKTSAEIISKKLKEHNLFLSIKDLENDLLNSELQTDIQKYFNEEDYEKLVGKMQERKAEFMFAYIKECKQNLSKLSENLLAEPLHRSKLIIENLMDDTN